MSRWDMVLERVLQIGLLPSLLIAVALYVSWVIGRAQAERHLTKEHISNEAVREIEHLKLQLHEANKERGRLLKDNEELERKMKVIRSQV